MYLLDANPANAILVEYIRRNLWLMQIFLVVHFQRKLTSAIIFVGMHFDSFSVSGVWGPIYRVLCLSLWMIVLFIIITQKNNLFLKNLNNTRGHNCIYSLASEQVFFREHGGTVNLFLLSFVWNTSWVHFELATSVIKLSLTTTFTMTEPTELSPSEAYFCFTLTVQKTQKMVYGGSRETLLPENYIIGHFNLIINRSGTANSCQVCHRHSFQ